MLIACNKDDDPIIEEMRIQERLFELPNEPFPNLSQYGFFVGQNMFDLEPHPTLIPYALPTELFSNYAKKIRYVYMPPNKKANYIDDDQRTLEFPDSTIIIKTFYYENDFTNPSAGRNIIETRLLIKRSGVWEQAEYIWNNNKTDAFLFIAGKQVEVKWIHFDGSPRSTLYSIPNHNECKGCHELDSTQVLLGPKARYLNSTFQYHDGPENQLDNWIRNDRILGTPLSGIPKAASFDINEDDLENKARTYLDINCAHCHNKSGPANNTGLFLDYNQQDSFRLGFCKTPIAAGGGSGGLDYALVPGTPDESILIYRLNSLELDVSMPELGRSVIHEEGLQLLRDWVAQLDGDCN